MICAGSASLIHTPPLSWHPFRKGTLARCRLYLNACAVKFAYIFIILGKGQTGCHRASPFERGTAEPGGMYNAGGASTNHNSPLLILYGLSGVMDKINGFFFHWVIPFYASKNP